MIPEGGQTHLGSPSFLALLSFRRFSLGKEIVIVPVFRIALQHAQPLETLPVRAIPDLSEQVVGVLFKVQQVVHTHQHFLVLFILRLLQLLLKGIEAASTVRASIGRNRLLFPFDV